MMSQEENLVMINEFLEKADQRMLVLALSPQGQICPSDSFPASSKTKVCVCLHACLCVCVRVCVCVCELHVRVHVVYVPILIYHLCMDV